MVKIPPQSFLDHFNRSRSAFRSNQSLFENRGERKSTLYGMINVARLSMSVSIKELSIPVVRIISQY